MPEESVGFPTSDDTLMGLPTDRGIVVQTSVTPSLVHLLDLENGGLAEKLPQIICTEQPYKDTCTLCGWQKTTLGPNDPFTGIT